MRPKLVYMAAALAIACFVCGPASAQWTTYQGDVSHDGYVPLSLDPATLSPLWQRSLGTTALNPVTAGNGEVFVSTPGYFSSGMGLQVLDAATGQTKWSKTYGSIFSVNPPSYANGKVYIQTGNHTPGTYLWAYDANTGSQIYSSPFQAQWESYQAPTIYEGTVYINGGYYGGMYAFDGSGGQQKWFLGLSQDDGWTPALDANYAYVYSGHYLTAVNRATGTTAFQINDADYSWSTCETVTLGGRKDAFAIIEGRLICFDLQGRNIRWQLKSPFNGSGQATVANGVVYAIDGGKLAAIDEMTGSLLWSWSPPSGPLIGTTVVTNTHVLTSTADTTYAVGLSSHVSAWTYPLGGALALSNRAIYVASATGALAAIAVPPSAIHPVAPSALSVTIVSPTSADVCATSAASIALSGTASELDASGGVLGTGSLASVTWSSSRGGSGVGFYDSYWNAPTAWSATSIALQPGENVITVSVTDLWGNTASDSITVVAPTGLSVGISSPTSQPTYQANTTPISLSGTAVAVCPSGVVPPGATLTSLTWSNSRGGSGSGTYSNGSTAPTTWSVSGVALKPGDNVITVTAADSWGHSATAVITVTAPVGLSVTISQPTTSAAYSTTATPIDLSGTANEIGALGSLWGSASLASLKWTNSRGGSGTGTYSGSSTTPTTWSIKSVALQGGDNVITVTGTDLWGNTGTAVLTVTWVPGSVGAAKKQTTGATVFVHNAVVTATTVASGSVFVESADRSSGIRLVTSQALSVGQMVSFTGTIGRVNGEYQISGATFLSIDSGSPLTPVYLTNNCIGNDRSESLRYVGLNTTGMLVRTVGRVMGIVSTQQLFYIDDGLAYQDGVGPVCGLRVRIPAGVALPRTGKWVTVTGVSRVEKFTLTGWGLVNGDWYPSGSVLYVPSVWCRNAGDIRVL